MIEIQGDCITAKVFSEQRDEKALEQIKRICSDPRYAQAVIRVMPDYHPGKGCVVGLTMRVPAGTAVSPDLVGVDISCGVLATELNARPDLAKLDDICHRSIPSGFFSHKEPVSPRAAELIADLKCASVLKDRDKLYCQLGTLGGGNHFIEVDELDGRFYLVIHSGSRNAGLQVAQHYTRAFERGEMSLEDYVHDSAVMHTYASLNRQIMTDIILRRLKLERCSEIESVHNYLERSADGSLIVRKGAIAAHKDQRCVIPLNMRDGTIVGRGLENPEWNLSAPHGAGRLLGRNQARAQISLEKFQETMRGIYTTTVGKSTLDEAPMAYKPAHLVTEFLNETLTLEGVMKPIFNFKAGEETGRARRARQRENKERDIRRRAERRQQQDALQ